VQLLGVDERRSFRILPIGAYRPKVRQSEWRDRLKENALLGHWEKVQFRVKGGASEPPEEFNSTRRFRRGSGRWGAMARARACC
jgi:hypothetical protein